MWPLRSKIVLALLLFLLIEIKCCGRDDFHYIRIAEKSVSSPGTKKVVGEFYELFGKLQPLTLPLEGSTMCHKNIQAYEENVKKAYLVHIRNHVVPRLYHGDVHDMDHLEYIKLEENCIEEVEPEAFLNVPKLKTISLNYNNISVIKVGVFNHLNVEKLYLNSNNISYIAGSAFNNMSSLVEIDLGNNKLKSWDSNWFTNTPNVKDLSISFNELVDFPYDAFKNLMRSIEVLNLSNNKINSIDAVFYIYSFQKLRKLSLENNKIDCFSDDVLNAFPKNITLSVAPNDNIKCLCWNKIQKWLCKYHAVNKDTIFFAVRHTEIQCNNEIVELLHNTLSRISSLEKKQLLIE